jgi:hypothetical protein
MIPQINPVVLRNPKSGHMILVTETDNNFCTAFSLDEKHRYHIFGEVSDYPLAEFYYYAGNLTEDQKRYIRKVNKKYIQAVISKYNKSKEIK